MHYNLRVDPLVTSMVELLHPSVLTVTLMARLVYSLFTESMRNSAVQLWCEQVAFIKTGEASPIESPLEGISSP